MTAPQGSQELHQARHHATRPREECRPPGTLEAGATFPERAPTRLESACFLRRKPCLRGSRRTERTRADGVANTSCSRSIRGVSSWIPLTTFEGVSPIGLLGVLVLRALRRGRRTSRGARTARRSRRGSTDRRRGSDAPAGSPTKADPRTGVAAARGSERRAGGLAPYRRRRSVGPSRRQGRRAERCE